MAGSTRDTRPPDPEACYRCATSLDDTPWARRFASHREPHADRYVDVEKRICLDCLAGLGLLAFARDRRDRSTAAGLGATRSPTGDDP